jgi:hypothetical protein
MALLRARVLAAITAVSAAVAATMLGAVPANSATATLTEVGAPFAATSHNGFVQDSGATGEVWSSPAVGDVTGDGTPEIVVGSLNSIVRVFRLDGSVLASIDPGRGPNPPSNAGATQASPALGDMNGDGVLDIVIANTGGMLAAYSLKSGSVSQIASVYVPPGFDGAIRGIFSTPALGYLDGNTSLDVATTTWGQEADGWSGPSLAKIGALHQWNKDTIWSSPAIGDVDGDGEVEIVYGADCEGSSPLQEPVCRANGGGGFVTSINLDGTRTWNHYIDNTVIWSSPALADLNGDGKLDVIVGTGLYNWGGALNQAQRTRVYALNGVNGEELWHRDVAGIPVGSAAVGEVDGGGAPEVFIVTRGGYLYSLNGDNSGSVRFQKCILDSSSSCPAGDAATHGGVALADIDGDGVIEAVVQGEQRLRVFDATSGNEEGSGYRSAYSPQIFPSSSTPTIASVNGKTWIVSALRGAGSTSGRDSTDDLVVTVWQSNSALGAAPWPTFKQNMQRTSNATPQAAPDNSRNENFVRQMYRDFLGREASAGDVSYWAGLLASRQIDRFGFASTLSRTDEWITSVIRGFYLDTLGREPDASGLRGWISAAQSGMPVAQIASAFYASPEYFATTGRNDYKTWVEDLYVKLLLRAPETSGVNGWVGALRNGMPRDTLTFGFYQSGETLGVRITKLYEQLLGRPPEGGAIANWSPFVSNQGDLVLAAALAASGEYFSYAQTPH